MGTIEKKFVKHLEELERKMDQEILLQIVTKKMEESK
jgi:hypothetical protein